MVQMRRHDREMDGDAAGALLARCEHGVLSTVDLSGQPYGVPVNFAYDGESIYLHSAKTGHKLDNVAGNPRVSFCVVGRTRLLPESFSTEYESVVVFGTASEAMGAERVQGLQLLVEKYSPGFLDEGRRYIADNLEGVRVTKITVHEITGKARLA